jgi:hypothetical protein
LKIEDVQICIPTGPVLGPGIEELILPLSIIAGAVFVIVLYYVRKKMKEIEIEDKYEAGL